MPSAPAHGIRIKTLQGGITVLIWETRKLNCKEVKKWERQHQVKHLGRESDQPVHIPGSEVTQSGWAWAPCCCGRCSWLLLNAGPQKIKSTLWILPYKAKDVNKLGILRGWVHPGLCGSVGGAWFGPRLPVPGGFVLTFLVWWGQCSPAPWPSPGPFP